MDKQLFSRFGWPSAVAAILVACILLSIRFWEWLSRTEQATVTNGETLRNVGLLVGGLLALLFALWRAQVASRQAAAAILQAETAHQAMLNDSYQNATEMLGSPVLSVRLGGIHALQDIAVLDPHQFHVKVMKQLCAYVRHPPEFEGQPVVHNDVIDLGFAYGVTNAADFAAAGSIEIETVREDIHTAVDSLTFCHGLNVQIESQNNFCIDLHNADLRGIDLSGKDLSRAPEPPTATPYSYEMVRSFWTDLRGANLRYTFLKDTNLSRTDLSGAVGLTQSILNDVFATSDRPPRLEGTFDSESGQALVWQNGQGGNNEP